METSDSSKLPMSDKIISEETLMEEPVIKQTNSDVGEIELPVLLPVLAASPILNLKTECESVFTPIQLEANDPTYNDSDDSKNRRMSREDIETMEIMQNEKSIKDSVNENSDSYPNTPIIEASVSTPLNNNVQEIASNEDSMASNITTRSTDPVLRHSSTFSSHSAADLIEYQWPTDGSGDYYMLQEQISSFLGITSFKRKYPEIDRRKLDPQEVNHLMTNMLISEVQVTLGLTAVRGRDVCDLMMREYPEKYQDYMNTIDEKQKESIKNNHLKYAAPTVEKSQMPNYLKKAMKQVSEYNARLNRQRKDDYGVYYDMQTNVLQYPKRKVRKLHPDLTRPSLYPCSLIPGQFQEYCQKYSSDELNFFPLNTVVYGPPPPPPPDVLDSISTSGGESELESMETETADTSEKSQEEGDEIGKAEKEKGTPVTADSNDASKEVAKLDDVSSKVKIENLESSTTVTESCDEKEKIASTNKESVEEELDESQMSYIDDPDKPVCGICLKDETCNKKGEPEDLITCSQCDNYGHPSCLDMSKDLISVIVTYNWQCLECKTCTYCSKPHHEDKMMFCDRCDRGYHTFCVGLRNLPSGLWMCPQCTRSDPDFAKRGGRRGSAGTPRKRKNSDGTLSDTPSKPKRKRRTKKEMEEAREKERLEKEERLKKRIEKQEEKRKKRNVVIKEVSEGEPSNIEVQNEETSNPTKEEFVDDETANDNSNGNTSNEVKIEIKSEKLNDDLDSKTDSPTDNT